MDTLVALMTKHVDNLKLYETKETVTLILENLQQILGQAEHRVTRIDQQWNSALSEAYLKRK